MQAKAAKLSAKSSRQEAQSWLPAAFL